MVYILGKSKRKAQHGRTEQYQRQVNGDKEHRLACQGPEKAGFLFGRNFHLISPFFDLIALTEYDFDVSRFIGCDLDLLS